MATYAFAKVGIEVDSKKGWGVRANGIWGWLVLLLTGNAPIITGKYRTRALLKGRPAGSPGVMYVANHCSWMDIPYVAMAIGVSRNFKIVAKKELLRVPILGSAISTSDNITVDRTSRRSQIETYKKGVAWLRKGVDLCTFPEGTRSEDGRLSAFKRGAFKMALKAGSPIVPISISYTHVLNPKDWVFPVRPARLMPVRVHVHDPVETEGKTEEEVVEAVQMKLCEALPECQRPREGAVGIED